MPSVQLNGVLPEPSRVREPVFVGIVWGAMAISFLFVCSRILIRLRSFGRLWFDDLFVVIGWSMIFATTIIWHFVERDMFMNTAIASGQLSPASDPTNTPDTEYYLHCSIAVIILFTSSLVAIKISFLLFFRRLTTGVYIKMQMIQWWVVFGITVSTWFASIGYINYQCLVPTLMQIAATCTEQWALDFSRRTLIANCVMDVATDTLIITIPIVILWNVRITLRQKLALTGIFSLTIITMTFAIVRVALFGTTTRVWDVSWLYIWSAIEPAIAVIISCLVSFRTLFSKQDGRAPPAARYVEITQKLDDTLRNLLSSKRNNSTIAMQNMVDKSSHNRTKKSRDADHCSNTSDEQILHREIAYGDSQA